MPTERERKFLINPNLLPPEAFKSFYDTEAGYFTKEGVAIRVTSRKGGKQKVCFKGPVFDKESGARAEFEYIIPWKDAGELLGLAPTHLSKRRFEYEGWEIDYFEGILVNDIQELWMAEYEEKEGKSPCPDPLPPWVVKEVTGDPEYSNQALAWKYGKKG